jgi:hypothetical protein
LHARKLDQSFCQNTVSICELSHKCKRNRCDRRAIDRRRPHADIMAICEAGASEFYGQGFTEVGRAFYRGVPIVYLEMLI